MIHKNLFYCFKTSEARSSLKYDHVLYQNPSIRSLLNDILTRHFSERRVDNSHLEKGQYIKILLNYRVNVCKPNKKHIQRFYETCNSRK